MTQPITKAIVPAAGLGTRLLPATKSQPKEMLPVGRKPAVQHVVEELQTAGLEQILMVTGRRKRSIEDHFDLEPDLVASLEQAGNEALLADLAFLNKGQSRFFYTRQSTPKGLGHAVSLASEFVGNDNCAVALGDSLIAAERPAGLLQSMMEAHVRLGAAAIVAVEEVPIEEAFRYGIVSLADGVNVRSSEPLLLSDIVEKPPVGRAPSNLAVAARYTFSPAIFDALARTSPDRKGEIQLTEAIRILIHQNLPVYAWLLPPGCRRYDVGNFESYFRTFIDFALADERYGYMVRQYIKAKAYEL
ncbi:MAG: UTP--glucose-1-phosphate uridylyltransferase [Caldilineales bacterium]|nr:UTP--glucose-1-phosphate uridylyltransferase [Caldilineales bacterium]